MRGKNTEVLAKTARRQPAQTLPNGNVYASSLFFHSNLIANFIFFSNSKLTKCKYHTLPVYFCVHAACTPLTPAENLFRVIIFCTYIL